MPIIVTSSGGAGHLQVAAVLEEAEKKRSAGDKKCQVVVKDVMKDFVGKRVGDYAVKQWNDAQKAGDIDLQNRLIKKQPLADRLFYLPIFFQTLKTLFLMKDPPKKIINTQVMGCKAILHALRIFNLFKRKTDPKWVDVKMEIWMTDFVSKKATHFLHPLSKLGQWEKDMIDIYIPNSPGRKKDLDYFLKATSSSRGASFRQANVHALEESKLPVKEIYKSAELKKFAPDIQSAVDFDLSWEEKAHGAAQVTALQSLPHIRGQNHGLNEEGKQYRVPAGDLVYTLMLGSQPTEEIVKNFVKTLLAVSGENKGRHLHFFAFCGKDEEGKASLFKEICQLVKNEALPKNLTIVPLPFQKQDNIARMLARSNRRFTRAGGVTSFQHLATHDTLSKNGGRDTGKVCIVAEVNAKEFLKDGKKIYDAIPGWEGKNAKYLVKKMGASIVSLDRIADELRSGFIHQERPRLARANSLQLAPRPIITLSREV